ncbi:MAG: tetratricopeptide repeat protein [Ardenticatenaceae bacterium]|nr:tetratricopeptide repeat protein [Ardenticatenaceae bacterium]MCB9444359.1 tetratricopeptide repeat protein [Ardenticatenaceae bacterium]
MSLNTTALLDSQYIRFRDLLQERSGIYFPLEKRATLARGLDEALRLSPCTNMDAYFNLLERSPSTHQEWDRLVSILTVGETYFFRNQGHFNALKQHILPEIIARRERFNRRLRIWSAGCATGEEPYSLAILLREMIPNLASWNVTILATDINREALSRAREGLYSTWSFRGVEKRLHDRYFSQVGNRYQINQEIKQMVNFEYLNLIEDYYPSLTNNTSGMDLIFCRNVTIYFSQEVTRQVVGQLYNCLVDGGWYIPGSSEPNLVTYKAFAYRTFPGAVVYQKPQPEPGKKLVVETGELHRLPQTRPLTMTKPTAAKSRPQNGLQWPNAYKDAQVLLKTGRIDEAMTKLYEKLDQDPRHVPTYCLLGKIYANRGQFEEAQHWCERAIEKDKLQPEPYFTLSMIYQGQGMVERAIDALKKTLYLAPIFVLAHYTIANLYLQAGDPKLAARHLQNVKRLLTGKPEDEQIPEGDGLVVGRLDELVEMLLANLA